MSETNRDSSVDIVARLEAGRSGFRIRLSEDIFRFSKMSKASLAPTQPPT